MLVLSIQLEHSPAYPLLDADFRERAKRPNDYFLLELSAYVRHRRSGAKKLVEELTPILKQLPEKGPPGGRDFIFSSWSALVRFESLAAAIEAQPPDKFDEAQLSELLYLSIDQPWAFHSLPIESVAVSLRTMERSLQELITAAARTEDLQRRLSLLELATGAANLLRQTWGRVSDLEKPTSLRSDSLERKSTIELLRELFRDRRVGLRGDRVATPAEKAAEVVWTLWHPAEQEYDEAIKGYRHDWRTETMNRQNGAARSAIVDLAELSLRHPAGMKAVDYPKDIAAQVAAEFKQGTAADWRKKTGQLDVERRLLLRAAAENDAEFFARVWPRLIEFVDWTGLTAGVPASFAAMWRKELESNKLDDRSWRHLQEWLTTEARAERYWTIVGESYPMQPGLSLFVAPTPTTSPMDKEPSAVLICRLDGDSSNMAKPELYRLTGERREPIALADDGPNLPPPMAAIAEKLTPSKEQTWKFDRQGFRFSLIAYPPKQK